MHATDKHIHVESDTVIGEDLQEALEFAWPEWAVSEDPQAALVAILDDGSLAELARLGDATGDREASDIWSDLAWTELIDAVREHGPRLHVHATGRVLVPLTSGPILYGALELQSPIHPHMDDASISRLNESLSPVLVDLLNP